MKFFFFLVVLVVLDNHACALIVHTPTSSTLHLNSVYTTISSSPSNAISANCTFIWKTDMQGCKFKNTSYELQIAGTIVIFVDYLFEPYLFKECVTDEFGNAVLFQKVVQEAGGVGVVTAMSDYETRYKGGSIAGFTKFKKIPFVVLNKKDVAYLAEQRDNISSLEIPAISVKEHNTIVFLNDVFEGMIIANSILFFTAMLTFGITLVRDIRAYLYVVPKRSPPALAVKLTVLISSFFAILYLLVDPGSFRLKSGYPSVFMMYMHIGTCFVVLYLFLGIWAEVIAAVKSDRFLWIAPYFVYTLSVLMLIFTLLIAILFYIIDVRSWYLPFRIFGIGTVVLCEIGYAWCGKNIVSVLCESGNSSQNHQRLSMRIVAFIVMFLVFANVAVFVFQTGTLGGIMGVMFFDFFIGLCFNSIFLILLFNHRRRPVSSSSKDVILATSSSSSGSGRLSNETPNAP